jgi:DNA mismatch repair protein MutS2
MTGIIEDSLDQLEFDKLLDKVASFAYSQMAHDSISSLSPYDGDKKQIDYELDLIEEGVCLIGIEDRLPFDGFADIRDPLSKSKAEGSTLSAPEIISINETIRSFRLFQFFFRDIDHKYPKLSEYVSGFHSNRILEKHINETIDETGEIRDTASRELMRIRNEIKENQARLRSRLEKIIKRNTEPGHIQDDYISIRDGRFVIPVKAESKRVIPGIIHGMSQTGGTVFMEPSEVFEMNNNLSLLANEEQNEIIRLLQGLTKEISQDSLEFSATYEKMLFLDTIIARSKYASEYNCQKPTIDNSQGIDILDCRHPLLVHKLGKDKVVPLSIRFGEDKRGFLISGPNAGGKTVAMKTVGLNIAMAMSGLFTIGSCRTPQLKIFTAIGDHQSIENDLSTFSSQLKRIKEITESADENSLVLIDEILSGTDPYEGSALASGILETFVLYKINFVVTTHQTALKTFALNNDSIENASLEYDDIKLKPTYKFLSGVPGNSYAFYLAESLGLNSKIIERAREFQSDKEGELEQSITILSKYRSESIHSRVKRDKERIELGIKKNKYEEKINDINSKRALFIENAEQEAEKILRKANSLIENTIREVREKEKENNSKSKGSSFNTIKKNFHQAKSEMLEEIEKKKPSTGKQNQNEEDYSDSGQLAEGDTVIMKSGNTKGTVISIDKNNDEVLVEFNGLKIKTSVDRVTKSTEKRFKDTNEYVLQTKLSAAARLDLRGMRAHEAIEELDKKISDSLLENIPQLTIVHGKGTGALRDSVQEFLRFHHHVTAFRAGTIEEGGSGVTIIEFQEN